jgi:hypothetical protein
MVRDDSPGSPGLRFETEAAPVRGVSWIRSLAVDYSGLCGAPALVAVADRVRAADPVEKAWRINLGEATLATQGRNPLPGTLTMERDGFRFAPPGRKAYLRATVAAPASVQFRVDRQGGDPRQTCVDAFVDPQATLAQAAASAMSRAMLEETPVGGLYGAMKSERPSTVDAIGLIGDVRKRIEHEASGAMDTTFLVVLTLQAGEAPRVERVETERGVAVKIGNRLVRFDGEALTLGDP